jgi:hypothetical protein
MNILKGSLSVPVAIYVLFDTAVEFYTGSIVYVMKCMLLFYIYKTNYCLLPLLSLCCCYASCDTYNCSEAWLVNTYSRLASSSLAAHLHPVLGNLRWSYVALLPCLADVKKLGGKEGELWLIMLLLLLLSKGYLYLQLLRCPVSRDKSGVARLCSVIVEMSSYLGLYRRSSGRAGRSLCYSHVHYTKNLHF